MGWGVQFVGAQRLCLLSRELFRNYRVGARGFILFLESFVVSEELLFQKVFMRAWKKFHAGVERIPSPHGTWCPCAKNVSKAQGEATGSLAATGRGLLVEHFVL